MRTARATVPLTSSMRPRSQAALALAQGALDNLTDGAIQTSPTRFVGYDTMRRAIYEAHYEDASTQPC